MVIKKLIVLVCFICFIAQSVYNIYVNTHEAKVVDITSTINLSSIPFPLQIQFIVEPGLDEAKLSELGFDLDLHFYAPVWNESLEALRNKNMTGHIQMDIWSSLKFFSLLYPFRSLFVSE